MKKKKKNKVTEKSKMTMKILLNLMSTPTSDLKTILMKNKFTELDKD